MENMPAIVISICAISFVAFKYFFPDESLSELLGVETAPSLVREYEYTFTFESLAVNNRQEMEELYSSYEMSNLCTLHELAKRDDVTLKFVIVGSSGEYDGISMRLHTENESARANYNKRFENCLKDFEAFVWEYSKANKKINKDTDLPPLKRTPKSN
jgi:hypothetical protein